MKYKNINKSIDSYLFSGYKKIKNYDRVNFIINEIRKNIDPKKKYNLLDIGCSKGEIIYALKEEFQNIKYSGLEYSEDLLYLAKQEKFLNDVNFIKGDARDFDLKNKFDFTIMSGVLSIFDEIDRPINKMLQHTKENGIGLIFGAFNKEDIDVLIRYKNNYKESKDWESGWNLFSLGTIKKLIEQKVKDIEIIKFNLKSDLEKKSDPVKSYSLELKNSNEKLIVTGGGIIRDFYLIKFIKN